MMSILPFPGGTYKYSYRVHRLVILPDYQGLGIGTKILDWFGDYYINQGKKLFIRSTHVRIFNHCSSDIRWKETNASGIFKKKNLQADKFKHMIINRRPAYSFEYMGNEINTKKHAYLVLDDNDEKPDENILKLLKDKYFLIVVTGHSNYDSDFELLCKSLGIRTQLLYNCNKGEEYKISKYCGYLPDKINWKSFKEKDVEYKDLNLSNKKFNNKSLW